MATLCTNCRTPLRDDAKFCNNCGTLTPSHPFSAKATSAPNTVQAPGPGVGRSDTNRPAMREQIAHFPQPAPRPVRRSVEDNPPSWMSHLADRNSGATNRTSSDRYVADQTPQLDFPVPEPLSRSNSPDGSQRELHVKVWQEEPISSPGLAGQNSDTPAEDAMDSLPTSPLIARSSNAPVAYNAASAPSRSVQDSRLDELERQDTEHLAAPIYSPTLQPVLQPSHARPDQSFVLAQQPTSSFVRGTAPGAEAQHYEPVSSRPTNLSAQSNIPVAQRQPMQQTPPPHAGVATIQRKQGRKPFVLILGLLVILLLVGTGVWVAVFHPFSVSAVVQPQQSFSNSQLAFAVEYPSGWNTRVDGSSSSAFFADSTNTAQFTVTVTPANGKDAGQYVQQLSIQLKMTGIRPVAALSFAGATWQEVQGNALFSGANYSETILATIHNSQLYTITQAAPQSTYSQEEQIVFSAMRASFKIL